MEIIPIMGMVTGIITTLAFFVALVLAIRYITDARSKEKMALIDKGVDLSIIYSKKDHRNTALKVGMFLVGIAVGLLLGNLLEEFTGINAVISYFSMTLLFGGASLILFHRYNSKQPD
jgi:hypothetical protein